MFHFTFTTLSLSHTLKLVTTHCFINLPHLTNQPPIKPTIALPLDQPHPTNQQQRFANPTATQCIVSLTLAQIRSSKFDTFNSSDKKRKERIKWKWCSLLVNLIEREREYETNSWRERELESLSIHKEKENIKNE